MALIFIEVFDIYYKLDYTITHTSIADNQKLFEEKQAYQSPTQCRVYDYKKKTTIKDSQVY